MRNEEKGGANLNYEMKNKKFLWELWQLHFTTFNPLPFSIINNPLNTLNGDNLTTPILLKCFKFNPMCEQI